MKEDESMELLTAQEEKEFLDAVATGFCPNCGVAIVQPRRGRAKKFCSDKCRFQWKNRHPKPENWKSSRIAVCPVCGKEFTASREYSRKRKYCSRTCANRGRAAEKKFKERKPNGEPGMMLGSFCCKKVQRGDGKT